MLGATLGQLGQHWGHIGAKLGQHWGATLGQRGAHWGNIGATLEATSGQHWGNIGATLGQHWGNPHWGHTGATLGQQNRILSLPGANKKFGGSLRGSSVKIGTIYREKLGVTKLAKIRLSSHACAAMAQPEEGVTYPRNVDVEPGKLKVVWLEHAS